MQHITQVDNTLWALISRLQGTELQTPYNPSNTRFRVVAVNADDVRVVTGDNDSTVTLTRAAFQQTLDYLASHRHFGEAHAVEIGSNKAPDSAGPLCHAARRQPDGRPGTMVITYILPILEHCQAVGLQRDTKPTSTWLLP
ncbi:hypothetical protein [Pseudomonas xanthosomatis]|uniref:hypothetical protein n=1 Tax=Pseudomonas xanthosomatis TaxID=2842356 RepID=UPI003512115F